MKGFLIIDILHFAQAYRGLWDNAKQRTQQLRFNSLKIKINLLLFDSEQWLVVLNRLTVFNKDF